MSDEHEHDGGHELEAFNVALLGRLLLGLTALVILSCFVVVQFFYQQRHDLIIQRGQEGSIFLEDYRTEMRAEKEGLRELGLKIASSPAMLAPSAPPKGWVDPEAGSK